jgi:hypothetical protein
MMHDVSSLVDNVKSRLRYREWHGRNRLGQTLCLCNWTVKNGDAQDWTICKQLRAGRLGVQSELGRQMAHARGLQRDATPMTSPPTVRTLFTNVSMPNAMVRVDLFECASRDEAHELLVRIVSDFESPLVEELKSPVGDVAFAGRGTGLILFARANVVYLLRNVGRRAVSVEPIALALDGAAVAVPVQQPTRAASFAGEAARATEDDLIEVPVADAPAAGAEDRWKYICPAGDLYVCDGCVTYRGPSSGLPDIKVCTD